MKKSISAITLLFFIGYFIVICLTFQDYGITWDEGDQNEYGKGVLRYYISGMKDGLVFTKGNSYLYGALFDSVTALINLFSPLGEYETRHLLNAILGVLGAAGTFCFAHYLSGSPATGLLAAVFLVLMPRYYGHAFNNPKDIPFAVFYLWSVYLLARMGDRWQSEENSARADWIMGLSIGACMGTLAPGLIILFYCGLLFFLVRKEKCREDRVLEPLLASVRKRLLRPFLIALCTMFVFWPYSHLNPVGNILYALNNIFYFPWNFSMMFDGAEIKATEVPWNYILKWYSVTTPFPQLLGLFLFLLFAPVRIIRGRGEEPRALSLIIFSMIFPLAWAIVTKSNLYDGLRHFLFLAPLIAVSGAWGFFRLWLTIRKKFNLAGVRDLVLRVALLSFLLGGLAPVVKWYIHSHPHQYLYFNQTINGVRGAFGKYETDYYGNSERQATLWLNQYVKGQNLGQKLIVCAYSNPKQISYYLDSKYFLYSPERNMTSNCDVFIANLRWGFAPKGTILHAISIHKVPLVYIILNDKKLRIEQKKASST